MDECKLGYVTFTQLVKVGEESALTLYTHILPGCHSLGEHNSSPYSWFSDRINQELLAFVHDILHTRATETIRATFESEDKPKPALHHQQFQFRKTSSFRGLFVFKSRNPHYHILIPSQNELNSPSGVCARFVTEYGRRVLPFLTSTTEGQGYSSYKVMSESLHAYVDCCEVTSSLGIFKVLKLLHPSHKVALDIASYFKCGEAEQSAERDDEGFPEVPLAGLYQRRTRKRTNVVKSSKQKSSKAKLPPVSSNQPLIKEAFKDGAAKTVTSPSSPTVLYSEADLPFDVIDHLCNFDSQVTEVTDTWVAPVISDAGVMSRDKDATPHLDVQPPPSKKHASNIGARKQPKKATTKYSSASEVIRAAGYRAISLPLKKQTGAAGSSKASDEEWLLLPQQDAENETVQADGESDSQEECPYLDTPPTPVLIHPKSKSLSDYSASAQQQRQPSTSTSVADCPSVRTSSRSDVSDVSDVSMDNVTLTDIAHSHKHLTRAAVLDDVTNTTSKSPTPVPSSSSNESVVSTASIFTTEDLEDDCIHVASEDEVLFVGSQEGRKYKKKMKSTVPTLEQILSGVKRVSSLTKNKIVQWLRYRKTVILDIYKGKEFSERHNDYLMGAKKRASLKYRVDTSMFGTEELDCLHSNVLNMFCSKDMKYFDYVMSVLIPECVIRMIADVNKVSFDEAEKMMYTYDSIDLSQDS